MNVKINSRKLRGSICAPSSPSYAVKTVIAAALSETATRVGINNITLDVRTALDALRSFGAMAWEGNDEIEIYPSKRNLHGCFVDARSSREVLDIMLGTVSSVYGYGEFTGEVTSRLIPLLNSHGCRVSGEKPPFIIQGKISSGRYVLPKDIDAYAVSGLLLSLPLTGGECEIVISDRLQNREYVLETIEVLSKFGIEILETAKGFIIPPKSKYTSPSKIQLGGDCEAAAVWLAAKALGCRVEILGLKTDTKKEIFQVFENIMHSETVNLVRFPHLAPIIATCAAAGEKKCRIVTGRSEDTAAALSSLGAKIVPAPDGFTVIGKDRLEGGVCTSYGNPYIALAAAICSVVSSGDVTIYDIDKVQNIYPRFFDDFKSLGGDLVFFE